MKLRKRIELIRACRETDLGTMVNIWYDASVLAHSFMPAEFWAGQRDAMKNTYLPAVENWIFEEEGEVQGFISLVGGRVCALFVAPGRQGRGIGTALIGHAVDLKGGLSLKVYADNKNARRFYEKYGFAAVREEVDEYTGYKQLLMELEIDRPAGKLHLITGKKGRAGIQYSL